MTVLQTAAFSGSPRALECWRRGRESDPRDPFRSLLFSRQFRRTDIRLPSGFDLDEHLIPHADGALGEELTFPRLPVELLKSGRRMVDSWRIEEDRPAQMAVGEHALLYMVERTGFEPATPFPGLACSRRAPASNRDDLSENVGGSGRNRTSAPFQGNRFQGGSARHLPSLPWRRRGESNAQAGFRRLLGFEPSGLTDVPTPPWCQRPEPPRRLPLMRGTFCY